MCGIDQMTYQIIVDISIIYVNMSDMYGDFICQGKRKSPFFGKD